MSACFSCGWPEASPSELKLLSSWDLMMVILSS